MLFYSFITDWGRVIVTSIAAETLGHQGTPHCLPTRFGHCINGAPWHLPDSVEFSREENAHEKKLRMRINSPVAATLALPHKSRH